MDIFPSRQLPTPPEPDTDYLMGGHHNTDLNASGVHVADWDVNVNPHSSTSSPLRRVSTLAYHNSPLRDPRERAGIRHRWLVVVTPPASLVQEHGPLGHTLASGPSQRLSQGILMPLLPTMYGQITAIAREFNFPSPVGLCLYLKFAEQGFSSSPRISDEIWPALWSHLFEARSPGSVQQIPIGGRIEFDIDRRKARWLDSWLTSDRRHAVDVPVSVPPSFSHWRGDSKNSFVDERADERSDVMPAVQNGVRNRHIPRKLSLVDKLETLSVTSSMANAVAGNGAVHDLSTSLATILQENEPQTAKIDLERRVESWRVSSSVAPTPIATTGQNSLETVNTSNAIQVNDFDLLADADGVGELDLDGFSWSISSIGPPDYDPLASATSTFHVPSVHLDGRLEGSVLLSPSTATSWGPDMSDYSPMLSPFRLPSPDIGQRVVENCPPTPSTVTSWGPEELLYSPESIVFRLPSPDLGMRVLDDSPCTPFTITSRDFPTAKGDRSGASDLHALHPNHVFPYFVAEHSSAWPLTWPLCESQTGTSLRSSQHPKQDPTNEAYDISGTTTLPAPHLSHVFPYFVPERCPAWTLNWPFHRLQALSNSLPSRFTKGNLVVETYDAAYRPVEIASEHIDSEESATPNRVSPTGTSLSPIHHDYVCDTQSLEVASIHLGTSYPNLRIYPPVYPFLSIYPPPPVDLDMGQEPPLVLKFSSYSELGSQYPYFDLYPAGYPTNLMYIYPPAAPPSSASLLSVHLPSVYPVIELYSPQYPFVTPYPPYLIPPFDEMHRAVDTDKPSNGRQVQSVNLKGDRPSYPAFDIYPAVTDVDSIYSNLLEANCVSVHLPEVYPRITPYPTVYPEFDLYPPVTIGTDDVPETALSYHYPCIKTYPVIYPYFEIYPGHISDGENGAATSEDTSQQSLLPQFDALYPFFDIYNTGSPKKGDKPTPLSVKVSVQYPRFNLYPPIYPYFEIFPSVALDVTENRVLMLASNETPGSRNQATGEDVGLTHTPIRRKVKKTHNELHEEVFGTDAPVKGLVEQFIVQPLGGYQGRSRARSGTIREDFTPQTTSSSSSPLPPVPPLPALNQASPRITFPGRTQELTHPDVSHDPRTDQPISELMSRTSATDHGGSMARSNSLKIDGSSPRRDYGHPKQSHRPRDSLVLEKVRLIDNLRAPPRADESTNTPVPAIPQLLRSQKLDLSKFPFA